MQELLTVKEVATRLRVDSTTVRQWIRKGVIEGVVLPHPGKRQFYRVKQEVLDAILNAEVLPA